MHAKTVCWVISFEQLNIHDIWDTSCDQLFYALYHCIGHIHLYISKIPLNMSREGSTFLAIFQVIYYQEIPMKIPKLLVNLP